MEKKVILLADDAFFFLELEKTFFCRDEFDVRTAHTGTEAMEIVKAAKPDVVFLDLYMPGMNGDECCRRIKADPLTQNIPIIMVTISGKGEDLERCREAGCDGIILKPINREHFIETAKKFLKVPTRLNPRYMARLKIQLEMDADMLLSGYSINLSTGGVFLETMNLMEEDTPLAAEFMLPTENTTIKCKAQVAWVNHPEHLKNPNLPVGMGIKFIELRQESLDAIRNYIREENLAPFW